MKDAGSDQATFVVHIQFTQNATWQGTIQWLEAKRTQKFRSALEMLKLMDEAVGSGPQKGSGPEEPSF